MADVKSPFDKEPAEGSRDIVERELKRQTERDHAKKDKDGGQNEGKSGKTNS